MAFSSKLKVITDLCFVNIGKYKYNF